MTKPYHRTQTYKTEKSREAVTKKLLRKRAGSKCERCGKRMGLQWCHIAGRKGGLKHYLLNILLLCSGCHLWFDNSANRLESYNWLLTKRTLPELWELEEMYN